MDLAELNNSQVEAVEHNQGPLLVLAGAGSGKTRVLTTRIAYLLQEKGVSPFNILAITFTNKAAREMKERVAAVVPDLARDIWIATFHATCVRILRKQANFLGYHENFVIYDDNDQETLLKECLKELNIDDKKYSPRAMQAAIAKAKNDLTGYSDYAGQAHDHFTRIVARVYEVYQKKLEQACALDFDDLIMFTVRLLQENEHVLAYYQNKFRYILVDEYQDTNHAQYVLINLLAGLSHNVFVVGDPDQSIYSWRGANIRNILEFEKDYPDARIIKLEQNYRSTQMILDAANHVIKHNRSRKEKRLWTATDAGMPAVVYRGDNERMEAGYIAGRIKRLRERMGLNYRDFAVLYRTNAMSRVVEEVFLKNDIPYSMVGGLRFYERKEIKDLLAYMRLLVNPWDEQGLKRVINVPKRGIGEVSCRRIIKFAGDEKISPLSVLADADKVPGLTPKIKNACFALNSIFLELRKGLDSLGVTEIAKQILERTGYWQELASENTVESRSRQENLKEFLSVTQEYDRGDEEGTLGGFLIKMALYTDLERYDQEADQTVLMTLHSAKGLEFPVVFLLGLEEGVFPHSRSLTEPAELEEERRLCYVGITRAKQRLYLTHCWQRTLYGSTRINEPSRFLKEIPLNLVTMDDSLDTVLLETSRESQGKARVMPFTRRSFANKSNPVSKEMGDVYRAAAGMLLSSYSPGDHVLHKKWGSGVVLEVRGEGEAAEIKVDFPDLGIKVLLARYAPLEKE